MAPAPAAMSDVSTFADVNNLGSNCEGQPSGWCGTDGACCRIDHDSEACEPHTQTSASRDPTQLPERPSVVTQTQLPPAAAALLAARASTAAPRRVAAPAMVS